MSRKALCFALFLATLPCPSALGQPGPARLSDLPVTAQSRIAESLSQDMFWLQLAELTASDGTYVDLLGFSVAIDGNTVVVGAPGSTVGSNQTQGAAYVFVKPKSGWENMTEVAKLTASDGNPDDQFGGSVAISGKTVLVGNLDRGEAYVFVRPPHGWKTGTETARLGCGQFVAINGDTTVCASGSSGAVYVRPKTGWKSTYNYDAVLVTTDGNKNFVSSVSTDGDVVVIGAADLNSKSDVAYLYVKPKGGWRITSNTKRIIAQKAILTASDSHSGDVFGLSVSVNGNTVAVGAPGFSAAYLFVKPVGGWTNMTETAKLTANTTDYDSSLGWAVALRGNILLAGNPSGTIANNHEGEAYVFIKPAGGWKTTSTFDADLTPSDTEWFDQFGGAVAISGQTILVGATHFQVMDPGAAYVFGH